MRKKSKEKSVYNLEGLTFAEKKLFGRSDCTAEISEGDPTRKWSI